MEIQEIPSFKGNRVEGDDDSDHEERDYYYDTLSCDESASIFTYDRLSTTIPEDCVSCCDSLSTVEGGLPVVEECDNSSVEPSLVKRSPVGLDLEITSRVQNLKGRISLPIGLIT
jgi:hypothetical protein